MPSNNDFWTALKTRLQITAIGRFLSLLAITTVFPIMEGIFVNLMTGADDALRQKAYGWCLLGIAVVHGLLAIIQLIGEFASPEIQLAKASEVQGKFVTLQNELRRREHAYGMVRESLKLLTRQTCALPQEPQDGPEGSDPPPDLDWCQAGFEAGLQPIIAVLTSDVTTAMGVNSSRFTIEVYLEQYWLTSIESIFDINGQCLRFFLSPSIERASVSRLKSNESPANIGKVWDVPNQQHIRENPAVFFTGKSPNPEVYFRRFASCPILEPCSDFRMGVLVLTSTQDDPFADDVLETLQFVASIVSNFVSSFEECYTHSNRFKAVKAAIPLLDGDAKARLAEAFDIEVQESQVTESEDDYTQ